MNNGSVRVGDSLFVTDGVEYAYGKVASKDTSSNILWEVISHTAGMTLNIVLNTSGGWVLWVNKETNISVSGEFTQTDVIGDPANILANPGLKDGWMGSWIPQIPDGVINYNSMFYSRKVVGTLSGSSTPLYFSADNGIAWTYITLLTDQVRNALHTTSVSDFDAGVTVVADYTAFAKQTKAATYEPVFNGEAGLGSVFTTGSSDKTEGCLLIESLIGKVGVKVGGNALNTETLTAFRFKNATKLLERAIHNPLTFTANSSVAGDSSFIKAFNSQTSLNSQTNIQYNYEQLVYAAYLDHGDNGYIDPTNNQSTNTDDEGNTVLTGTATLAIPYGWSKNNT
jgi:hypothetical protein